MNFDICPRVTPLVGQYFIGLVSHPSVTPAPATSLMDCWNSADWLAMSVNPKAPNGSPTKSIARSRNTANCARVTLSFGQKLALPQPVVMPSSARKMMSSMKLSDVLPRSLK